MMATGSVGVVMGLPLAHEATAGEVMELLDALAFRKYPAGYWQLTWTTSCLNLVVLLAVAMAMRLYGCRKNATFWLLKLERRTYSVQRPPTATHPHRREANHEATRQETRVGRFITASCVNCHLVLTSLYVLTLFVKVCVSYSSRGASDVTPVLSPDLLDQVMHAFIFSTGYFAALGYMAVLFPHVSPRVWNTAVVGVWCSVILTGSVFFLGNAGSAARIESYRTSTLDHLSILADLTGWTGPGVYDAARVADHETLRLAASAYAQAQSRRMWLVCEYAIIALGGVALSAVYTAILVLLTRRIARELARIRSPAPRLAVDRMHAVRGLAKPESGVTETVEADGLVISKLLAQQGGLSQLPRARIRTPPSSPAPSTPLPPLPPPERAVNSRGSTPDSATHNAYAHDEAERRSVGESLCHDTATSRFDSSFSPCPLMDQELRRRHARTRPHASASFATPSNEIGQHATAAEQELHDGLASHEGYVAVCRFLFNCCIDHVVVTLLCLEFGITSLYLGLACRTQYPLEAATASLSAGHAAMFGAAWFTLLYLVNSLNLFAPFLLFPSSQLKLATMLTTLAAQREGRVAARSQRRARRAARARTTKHALKAQTSATRLLDHVQRGARCSALGDEVGEGYPPSGGASPSSSAKSMRWCAPTEVSSLAVGASSRVGWAGYLAAARRRLCKPQPRELASGMDTDPPPRLGSTGPSEGEGRKGLGRRRSTSTTGSRLPCSARLERRESGQSTSTMPARRELVLDALISSRALPIQGFYCLGSNALPLSESRLEAGQAPRSPYAYEAQDILEPSAFARRRPEPLDLAPRPSSESVASSLFRRGSASSDSTTLEVDLATPQTPQPQHSQRPHRATSLNSVPIVVQPPTPVIPRPASPPHDAASSRWDASDDRSDGCSDSEREELASSFDSTFGRSYSRHH